MPQHEIKLSQNDIETIKFVFDDDLRIQIFFKIFKKPDISSKELKRELYKSGTLIYYHLGQLIKENDDHHAIITATEHKDSIREHLIMKTYRISEWMMEIINTEKISEIYSNDLKNRIWKYTLHQRIGMALINYQLIKFETKNDDEIIKEIDNLPVYNFALITSKTAEIMKNKFKSLINDLSDQEDQKKSLFKRMQSSDYSIFLNSVKVF